MLKREFASISSGSTQQANFEAVSQVVRHAEELLRSAQGLKKDIQAGKTYGQDDVDQIKLINTDISLTIAKLDDSTTHRKKAIKLETSGCPHVQTTAGVALTAWRPDDPHESCQPDLPPIHDKSLERMVFTHAGLVRQSTDCYERLEWIGDAYLYLMASAFIYQTFPKLSAGRSSQYRELLVRNMTLAKYTESYHLEERLKLPPELLDNNALPIVRNSKHKKILGDVFEAYVAGIILGDPEQGLARASSWMKTLWRGELEKELKEEFSKRSLNATNGSLWVPNCQGSILDSTLALEAVTASQTEAIKPATELPVKVQLAQAIGGKGIKIEYKDEGEPKKEKRTGLPWYTVGIYLTGWGVQNFKLGFGSALSKKEAGSKAAQAALENKKTLGRFEQKKKEFDAAVRA